MDPKRQICRRWLCHCEERMSIDHFAPPLISRKILPSNIAQSVRLSCIISHNPLFAKISTFIVAIATIIIMINGMDGSRVNSRNSISVPHVISNVATNGAKNLRVTNLKSLVSLLPDPPSVKGFSGRSDSRKDLAIFTGPNSQRLPSALVIFAVQDLLTGRSVAFPMFFDTA
jgi:hypothetical protein